VCFLEKGVLAKGYFISKTGINEKIIKEYVKMQEKEDVRQADLEFWKHYVLKGVG